jgi:hypothetical protein
LPSWWLLGNFQPGIMQWLGTPGFEGARQASCERQGITVDLLFKASNVRLAGHPGNVPGNTAGTQFKVIATTTSTELLASQWHDFGPDCLGC